MIGMCIDMADYEGIVSLFSLGSLFVNICSIFFGVPIRQQSSLGSLFVWYEGIVSLCWRMGTRCVHAAFLWGPQGIVSLKRRISLGFPFVNIETETQCRISLGGAFLWGHHSSTCIYVDEWGPQRNAPLSMWDGRFMCVFTTHCNTLQHTAAYCHTLQHTCCASFIWETTRICYTLQHAVAHCNTLRRTASHCNTLHRTATRCNTLQHTWRASLNWETL